MESCPLVVLTGPPGSGKSTTSRLVARRFEPVACLIESDWWWTTIVKGGIPPWLPAAHAQNQAVVRSFSAAACAMVAAGFPTVLDGVVGPWVLDLVLAEAERATVEVHYIVLRPALDISLGRARSREGEERVPGHPALTDPEPIRKMWLEFSKLGRFENHVVDNGKSDAAQTAELVMSLIASEEMVVRFPIER